jgi:hypothetical protein
MKGIKVEYIIDNDNWTEEEYEQNQDIDREFIITWEMIENLILQNSNLEPGDYLDTIIKAKLE